MYQLLRSWEWVAVVVGVVGGISAGCSDMPPEQRAGRAIVRVDPATAADCPHGGSVILAGVDRNDDGALDPGEIDIRTPVCTDAVAVVTRTIAEPPGAHCSDGGTAVQSGLDANHNGRLDDDEVNHTDYVCGSAPPDVVVVTRFIAEPPGAHCSDGGTAVQSGPDRNGNGRLDDDEVSHIDYLCGDQVLTRFTIESPGANCVAGGVRIDVGHDRDGDGVLDDSEIEHTAFSCSDVFTGSVVIRSANDAAALAHIHTIAGSLQAAAPLDELALPELVHLSGSLGVAGVDGLTRISLPQLVDAGGLTIENDAALTSVDLPSLAHVAGDLVLRGNAALEDLTAFAATASAGSVTLDDNPALASARIPASAAIEIRNDPALSALAIAGGAIGQVVLAGSGLTALTLHRPALTGIGSATITGNPRLDAIDLAAGTIGALDIEDNAALHRVSLAADSFHGDIVLIDPVLDEVSFTGSGAVETRLDGALTVSSPIRALLATPMLHVTRDLTLEATQLTAVDRVREVGGKLRMAHNPRLRGRVVLLEVRGGIEIVGNAVLTGFEILGARALNGDVTIADNPAFDFIGALVFAAVHGDLTITGNPALTTMIGPDTVDGRVTIANDAALDVLSFDNLRRAGDLSVHDNAAMTAIFLSRLTGVSTLDIASNAALDTLELPALMLAHEIHVDHNHALASCEVLAVFAHITADVLEQSDNDDAKTCAPDGRQ